MISINNNTGGMRAHDALQVSHRLLQTSLERLSTGIRINRAEDDAAGLMVRDRFQAQVNGLEEAIRNIQTGQGMIQVAEQGLNKITDALQQMRALAVRAADDNLSDGDRGRIQEQVKGLLKEINERAARTTYNGHNLLNGSIADTRAERQGSVQIQTNSFLSDGHDEIASVAVTGSNATATGGVSQGSYEVVLAFSGQKGVRQSATSRTTLAGYINSGPNGDGTAKTASLTQVVTDRNGGAHVASFTFTQASDGTRNYDYRVSIADGGVYRDSAGSGFQTFNGTMEFKDDGTIKAVDGHPPGALEKAVILQDGTQAGQAWTIGFDGLKENQHAGGFAVDPVTVTVVPTLDPGPMTSNVTFTGTLDEDDAVSSNVFETIQFFDRLGVSRNATLQFAKNSRGTFGTSDDLYHWSVSTVDVNSGSGGASAFPGSGINEGNIQFSTSVAPVVTGSTMVITDSNSVPQTITLNFSALTNPTNGIVNNQNTAAESGFNTVGPSNSTSLVTFTGNLDEDDTNTSSVTKTVTFADRTNTSRTGTIVFSKLANGTNLVSNDLYQWTFAAIQPNTGGGAGTATVSASSSGTIQFTGVGSGNPATVSNTTVTLVDSTTTTQTFSIDFSALTNSGDASTGQSTINDTARNGATGTATTALNVSASLVVGQTPSETATVSIVDRTGAHQVDGNRVYFTQNAANLWTYHIEPNTSNGAPGTFLGSGSALTGTILFNSGGQIVSTNGVFGSSSVTTTWATTGMGTELQTIGVSFAGVSINVGPAAQSTSNGTSGVPTTGLREGSSLASTHNVSDTVTTAATQVFDRTGTDHSVSMSYTKVSEDAGGETWQYNINGLSGGVWTGSNSGTTTGTLRFNGAKGARGLTTVNGATSTVISLVLGDGTPAGQAVTFNFGALTISTSDAVAVTQIGGTVGNPTTHIQITNNLIASNGSAPGANEVVLQVVDRTGVNLSTGVAGGAGPRINFRQVGESNRWTYTITAPTGSGFSGFGTGLQGQVEFDDAGNIIRLDGSDATFSKTVNFADFTAEGQAIAFDFRNLNMARQTDFTDSITDGGQGTDVGEVNAVVYFSDGSGATDLNPVSTLVGVDIASRSYSAGGISFTVHQASTIDAGLKSYIKAYTYVSAASDSRGLQFQVGADEGETTKVGISKMDVSTIFRLAANITDGGNYSYLDISVENQLRAQDLIGQIDDALNFVSSENLKVGQFQNSFTRWLDLQRQNMTSISGALSNLNDTDMAYEAMAQSKRTILIQSGTAMVAQANTQGQFLLQLLR